MMEEHHSAAATTIAELDLKTGLLIRHLTEKLQGLADMVRAMSNTNATKSDIADVRADMARMATKVEVEHRFVTMQADMNAKVEALRKDIEQIRPSTLLRGLTAILGAIALAASVLAMIVTIGDQVRFGSATQQGTK
jgi:hypothetical protein